MVEANPVAQSKDGGQEEVIEDAEIFQAKKDDIFTDDSAQDFTVLNPQDFHGHVVYEVKGKDLQGEWECKRRYNEFYVLFECLQKRWPGILLPQVPPKKAMGHKEQVFIQERRYYLERYLRKLAKFDFVINSQEFQLFCRPQGLDVEKSLSKLPKLSIGQLYERLKEATNTDEKEVDERTKDQIEVQLTELSVFIKKIEPFLKQLKADLAGFLSKK